MLLKKLTFGTDKLGEAGQEVVRPIVLDLFRISHFSPRTGKVGGSYGEVLRIGTRIVLKGGTAIPVTESFETIASYFEVDGMDAPATMPYEARAVSQPGVDAVDADALGEDQ